MNLSQVILSPRLNTQEIPCLRSSGAFDVDGVWVENTPQQLTLHGIVTVMNEKELNQLPEGNKIKAAMKFQTVIILQI